MILLITADEAINIAFVDSKNFIRAKIKDTMILATQYNWIRPVLGNPFYQSLLSEIQNESLSDENALLLEDYIQPCLAYYVKYTAMPDLMLQLTNKGGQKAVGEYSETITASERGEKREATKAYADTLRSILVDFLTDNAEQYPNYDSLRSDGRKAIRGGLLLGRRKRKEKETNQFINTSNTKIYDYQADESGYFSIDFEDIKAVGEQVHTVVINTQGQLIDSNDYEFNSSSENQILEVWLLTDNEIDKTGKITITVPCIFSNWMQGFIVPFCF